MVSREEMNKYFVFNIFEIIVITLRTTVFM